MQLAPGTTTLNQAQLAELTHTTPGHLGALSHRDHIATVSIEPQADALAPAEWDLLPGIAWRQLRDEYEFVGDRGDDVPSELMYAVDHWMPQTRGGYQPEDREFRLVAKYAALHGYSASIVRFTGTDPSGWTNFLFLFSADVKADLRGAVIEEWRQYWDGEVYAVTVTVDGASEAMGNIYGTDEAADYAGTALLTLVEAASRVAAQVSRHVHA
ncbi:hypothetical protein [Gordonia alkanivorans]|uniref:hypothetical protein n=1 Tax=Gordonia alkanivorans TaxID=84096 RepID=UPI0004B9DF82|nr:hypothetical protein [Gordonia alkanivorans]